MSEIEIPLISKKINSNNYLVNSYRVLTRSKIIHFLFILIEIILNIFQELEIFIRGFKLENINKKNTGLNYVSFITNNFDKLEINIKLIIIIIYFVIIDFLYIFFEKKNYK